MKVKNHWQKRGSYHQQTPCRVYQLGLSLTRDKNSNMYGWVPLLSTWNHHNIVNRLYVNKKFKDFLKRNSKWQQSCFFFFSFCKSLEVSNSGREQCSCSSKSLRSSLLPDHYSIVPRKWFLFSWSDMDARPSVFSQAPKQKKGPRRSEHANYF